MVSAIEWACVFSRKAIHMSGLCSDFITCSSCGGSGEDRNKHLFNDCPHCAGRGEHPRYVSTRWYSTRLEWIVVVESLEADVNEVIFWGRFIGANSTLYGEEYLTVEFKDGSLTLPRVPKHYSEQQLRWIFENTHSRR